MSTLTEQKTLFGHPTGLFTLFFAEMWERFSYYGMRALLIFYITKGFLGLNDTEAYGIYGAYTALVYMTPYFGGMLADRLLGRRQAVVIGGLLMAGGHLLMMVENSTAFFGALALLIVGNGFFKPNISTIVGELYPKVSAKKDAGFTIFYMGINLGAAMSPIVCGYVGETYGWHYGFGLATIGMLVGVAVFVAPTRLTQLMIGSGALATAVVMPFWQDSLLQLIVRIFLGLMLLVAGGVAVAALNKSPLPKSAGAPPDPEKLDAKVFGILPAKHAVYLGTAVAIVALAFVVQNQSIAGYVLNITGVIFLGYLIYEMVTRCTRIERNRLIVVLVLFFFNMLFWAFFEQAGSSLNNWTDRNIDRVMEDHQIDESEIGSTIAFRVSPSTDDADLASLPLLSQEQLGRVNGTPEMAEQIAGAVRAVEHHRNQNRDAESVVSDEDIDALAAQIRESETFTMTGLTYLRGAFALASADEHHRLGDLELAEVAQVEWQVDEENVGMGISDSEIPASEFQAANPIYIILFGLPFSALWAFLAVRGRDPSTPVKFGLGIIQLGVGFCIFWYAAQQADARGMSSMVFLLLGLLILTTGELCSSPVGLSMVTKLSPTRLVSTVMGGWFLATAFSNYLAALIAKLTGVSHEAAGLQFIPPPTETAAIYGDVFGLIGITAIGAGIFLLLISPFLKKGMHLEEFEEEEKAAAAAEAAPAEF